MGISNVALLCICMLMALIAGYAVGYMSGYSCGHDDGVKKTLNKLEASYGSWIASYEEARDEFSQKAYKEKLESQHKNTNNDE